MSGGAGYGVAFYDAAHLVPHSVTIYLVVVSAGGVQLGEDPGYDERDIGYKILQALRWKSSRQFISLPPHPQLTLLFVTMLAFKTLALALSLFPSIFAASTPRIDKDKATLLVVDHQVGLFELVQDINPIEFRNNIVAHAELGVLFNLPTILTTSAETGELQRYPHILCLTAFYSGPNGPLPKEITRLHPNATFVRRNGEVDAWSNEEFRAAVKATNKSQIILAGITTDVSAVRHRLQPRSIR